MSYFKPGRIQGPEDHGITSGFIANGTNPSLLVMHTTSRDPSFARCLSLTGNYFSREPHLYSLTGIQAHLFGNSSQDSEDRFEDEYGFPSLVVCALPNLSRWSVIHHPIPSVPLE
ncbi:MAG: hypothetical protein ACOCXT_02120 [Candidatus Dojkabacteria bacterium]